MFAFLSGSFSLRDLTIEAFRHARKTILALVLILILGSQVGCLQTFQRAYDWFRANKEKPISEFEGVTWLHNDISGWKQTTTIESVSFPGNLVSFPFDKARVWPTRTDMGTSTPVIGNVWVVFDYQGKRYAATWEWLRPGQTAKVASTLDGHHIGRAPIPSSWRPAPGERIWIMVSSHARHKIGSVRERSGLAEVVWQ